MSNLISIKSFLGKYYSELQYSAIQDKYKDTKLDTFFEQRYYIQNNKIQMIVDPGMKGLIMVVNGNEIQISKELYDHPNVLVTNSLENKNNTSNPRSLYNAEIFSTLAYLTCQNHSILQIIGEIDEPIYVKYKTDYETFYNSVVVFEVSNDLSVEIVEEIESRSALNSVVNYILQPYASIKLTTFYQNHISAISFVYRNIIAQDNSRFSHILLGKGSSNVIDENKICAHSDMNSEFLGVIDSDNKDFHAILYVVPASESYRVSADYRCILDQSADVTFFPAILGQEPAEKATISVSNISVNDLPEDKKDEEIKKYTNDIVDRVILERMIGTKRFYDNKARFLQLP